MTWGPQPGHCHAGGRGDDSNGVRHAENRPRFGGPDGRLEGENAAATATDVTFDAVTFNSKTLIALAKMSVELFEDAVNGPEEIENAIAQALAVELDRAALLGSGAGAEPAGIYFQSGIQIIQAGGANGAALTNYDKFVDLIEAIENVNGRPNAVVYAPRTKATLGE